MKSPKGARVLLLGAVFAVPLIAGLPITTAALHRSMILEIRETDARIFEVEEQLRVLEIRSAELKNPDRVARIAEHVIGMHKATEDELAIIR